MTILVTGSAGHLGEGLMRTLRRTGKDARGIDIKASPSTDAVGSITDRLFVATALEGVDAVIHTATLHKPPGGKYRKVSTLVPLPDFVPGLGTLYVDPATLPAGPFLAYDHRGNLVSSIYMVPLKDMNAQKSFPGLKAGPEKVNHVDIVYNAGHPGVAEPHYHMIVWYISPQRAAQLAR